MKEPVDHILRPSLPWRSSSNPAITECGYDGSKVKAITRQEFFQRLKDMGQQRCAMLTCMTCSDTAKRWATWDDDPREALNREIAWERGGYYRPRDDRGHQLLDELLAIANLIEQHRDEFDAQIAMIIDRRKWNEKKAAAQQAKPKTLEPW